MNNCQVHEMFDILFMIQLCIYIFKHCNFINVSTRIIIEAKLVICFYFNVSRMLKLCRLLTCSCSFNLHDLDYDSYSLL